MTWQSPQSISGDADVNLDGVLAGAFNIGPSGTATVATTVNGVTFSPFNFPASPFTSSTAGTSLNGYTFGISATTSATLWAQATSSTAAPFSTLSPQYQTLLRTAGASQDIDAPRSMTLTIGGLTIGRDYLFQWWSDRSIVDSGTAQATAGATIGLSYNTTGVNGGLGQFGVGRFTADGTSQNVTFSPLGASTPWVNGFQVRVVPEPATLALIGIGAIGGLAVWRRRSRIQ